MVQEIRFCKPEGDYGFLSPLSEFPIKMSVDGKVFIFPTVEHYYQAMKFYVRDPRFYIVLNQKDPDEARLLTKEPEYQNDRRKNFDQRKYKIMENALRAKFKQNPDAAELLKSTGDAILIKSCPVCYKCGFGEGSGYNRIGNILMDIRKGLQK